MRVLQIIQKKQLRGAEIFACQLSEELIKMNVHVDVLHLYDTTGPEVQFNLNFIPLQASIKKRFIDLKGFRRLAKIIEEGRYDVVQANAADTLKYAVFSKLLFGWNQKLIFRNANLMGRFMRSPVHKFFNRWLLSKCSHIISVSELCRQDVIALYPEAEQRSTTIRIGTYVFDHVTAVERNIPNGEHVLINIGSFVPEKNHSFLIEIFKEIVDRTGTGYLWLVGDGPLRSVLEEQAKKLDLADRVVFWGYRNDAIAILKAADILVMPSLIEGIPGAILEAFSCEIPVVASAAGGIKEVVESERRGIIIEKFDVPSYASGIMKLIDDQSIRTKITREAKAFLYESLMMDNVANEFRLVYEKLISQ